MPNAWEQAYGFDPVNAADAAQDADEDGYTNLEEWLMQTDPRSAASKPPVTTDFIVSFEQGIPSNWKTSSPYSTQAWSTSTRFATLGLVSALAPASYSLINPASLSTTRNFFPDTLTFDYLLVTSNASIQVTVDGEQVSLTIATEGSQRGTVTVQIPAGVHELKISTYGAANTVYLDNLRFGEFDTDGDGLPSFFEVANGLDPLNPQDAAFDSDQDGLSNRQEFDLGSHIYKPDTDGDGLGDGQEVQLGTKVLGRDSDGDFMPDGWEVDNGLDPTFAFDADEDYDDDGFTNLQEYRLKTNPQDDSSVPTITPRWFESFEDGVPADASSDATSDATSDQWSTTAEYHTLGAFGLKSPVLPQAQYFGQVRSRSIGFTKYFEAGQLTADYYLKNISFEQAAYVDVLIDDIAVSRQFPWSPSTLAVEIAEGVHTIEFRISAPSYVVAVPTVDPVLYLDNIRYVWNGDTDSDGLPDRWEYDHGFNPDDAEDGNADADDDGLTNGQEFAAGSNMNDADSDDDSLGDAEEVAAGTNPASSDSDADGIPDNIEFELGFDPLNASDASADADGDRISNRDEYRLGTDPHDAASIPARITNWFESFESGLPADWDSSSDAFSNGGWLQSNEFVTEGEAGLRSASIGDSGRTQATFVRNFAMGTLKIDYHIDSEPGYDYLRIFVDGAQRFAISGGYSGTAFVGLSAGVHEVRIEYRKDSSSAWGRDAAWIDNLRFNSGALSVDSDSDGLPDTWEVLNGTSVNNPSDATLDYDGDGLTNLEEFSAGTSIADSDSDNDGLTDGEEVLLATNPLDADSDNDGLSDAWEVANRLDPQDASDAGADFDGDGYSNLQEFEWHTDLRDPAEPQFVSSWFESFENGSKPADWDASADASTDASTDTSWHITDQIGVSAGQYALRSGAIERGQSSVTSVAKFLSEAGVLFFDYRVDAAAGDALNVFVNGAKMLAAPGAVGAKRGEITIDTAGRTLLQFVYTKSARPSSYTDAAYIDNVRFFSTTSDNDSDGMNDIWEVRHGLSPVDTFDAAQDPDGDQYTNLQEFINGTDPFAANTPPPPSVPPDDGNEPPPDDGEVIPSRRGGGGGGGALGLLLVLSLAAAGWRRRRVF